MKFDAHISEHENCLKKLRKNRNNICIAYFF